MLRDRHEHGRTQLLVFTAAGSVESLPYNYYIDYHLVLLLLFIISSGFRVRFSCTEPVFTEPVFTEPVGHFN